MRYLGRMTSTGTLRPHGGDGAPATFEFECYLLKAGMVTSSGEIASTPEAVQAMLGRNDVEFLTDDGHLMKLMLADRKATPAGGSAHVVATGDLPVYKNGVLAWDAPAAARSA